MNYLAVILATVLQFIAGAIWYMAIFPKQWGEMFGFEKLPKAEQLKMKNQMGPYYALQMLVTFMTAWVLGLFEGNFTAGWHAFGIAGFAWLGFVVPTQVSAVIFGGVEPKWIKRRIVLMAGGSLFSLMVAAAVFYFMP